MKKKNIVIRKFYLVTEIEELESITGLSSDQLWNKDVCLDDWDYFIVTKTKEEPKKLNDMDIELSPKDELVWHRLLDGCSSNDWYHIKTPNGIFYIGGAYHS